MTAPEDQNSLREALARAALTGAQEDQIAAMYVAGHTLREIAPIFGVTHGGVQSALKRRGVSLRAKVRRPGLPSTAKQSNKWKARALAAEAEITRLRGVVEVMGAALKPFAEAAQSPDPPDGDDDVLCWGVRLRIGDLRVARAAIPPKEHRNG